jgi:murein DD-endopeptidase MepM/ murein hydrolase activator NlpD
LVCGRGVAEPSAGTPALTSNALQGAAQSVARLELDASGKPAFLARFSDGPRRVPVARGAAKARAERLGLGGHEAARHMLWTRPDPELLAEVRGEAQKKLLWPVIGGTWGRGFGYTRTLRPELPHNGVDIGAKQGDVVRAVADGLVVYSDNGLLGYGNCVMILHPNGWLSLYAHTQRTTVQPGWRVKRGERIALVGKTGYAWGPHLHFELRDNGKLRDPAPLFTGQRSPEINGPQVVLEPDQAPSENVAGNGRRAGRAQPRCTAGRRKCAASPTR